MLWRICFAESLASTETHACDSISRQKAINTVKKMRAVCDTDSIEDYEALLETAFEALPSAHPETANIIVGKSRDGMTMWYQCDNCNEPVDKNDLYCRGCGRRFEHGSDR